jgi:uncharacterized protein (TIGR04255 family)
MSDRSARTYEDLMSNTERLATPHAPPARFEKNFLRQVVCEFRFPTLFELEAPRPPSAFATALRKEFPTYEVGNDFNVSAGQAAATNAHIFRSRKGDTVVTLRAAAIAIECTKYTSYEDFREKLVVLVKAAEAVIDSPFFTRIGLRYIDYLPVKDDDLTEWIKPQLVGALIGGVFPGSYDYSQRIGGRADVGFYTLQHGFGPTTSAKEGEYVLDFDFAMEDVAISESLVVIDKLHEQMYSLFHWTLGKKALELLGPSKLKPSGERDVR